MAQQETRIKVMETELAKMRQQKAELEMQKKYGEDRFSKLKDKTGKEIVSYKKTVQDKEKTVFNLKSELKKTD